MMPGGSDARSSMVAPSVLSAYALPGRRVHETVAGSVANGCDSKTKAALRRNADAADIMGANPNLNETVKRFKMLGVKGPTELAFDFNWTQITAYQAKE
ncbi:MAG: hypothetical protein ACSHXD_10750 [Marinosulfonomonas sp.]